MNLKKLFMNVAILACFGTIPNMAFAQGYHVQDYSARGASLANSLVARNPDASAVAYNPAAITELEGTQILMGSMIVVPSNTISSQQGRVKSKDMFFPIPHGYVTHKLNDKFSLGFGMYTRFGLGNEYDMGWFGNANMYASEMTLSNMTANLAWRVNEKLSVAVGLEAMGGILTSSKHASVGGNFAQVDLKGDAVNFGVSLAMHYRFNEQWKAGFTYRSHITLDVDGEMGVINGLGAGFPIPTGVYDVTAKIYTPDVYNFGLAYYPTEKLSLEATVGYITWSRNNELPVEGIFGITKEYKNMDDSWLFALGAEYEVNDWLTLRAGISHETTAMNPLFADYSAPADAQWKYATGLGIKKGAWTFDFAYYYLDMGGFDYSRAYFSAPSGIDLTSKVDDYHCHSFLFDISYKF